MNSLEEGYRFLPFFPPERRPLWAGGWKGKKNPENPACPAVPCEIHANEERSTFHWGR